MLYRGHTATIVRTRITIHKNCCLSHQGMRWYHYTLEHLRTNSQPFLYFNIIIIVRYLADTYRPWSIINNRTKTSTKHIKTRWVVSTILPTWFTALLHRYVANISMKDIVASYKYAYQFVTIECRSVSINKLNCVKIRFLRRTPGVWIYYWWWHFIRHCKLQPITHGVWNISIYAQMNVLHLNVSELVPNYPLPL